MELSSRSDSSSFEPAVARNALTPVVEFLLRHALFDRMAPGPRRISRPAPASRLLSPQRSHHRTGSRRRRAFLHHQAGTRARRSRRSDAGRFRASIRRRRLGVGHRRMFSHRRAPVRTLPAPWKTSSVLNSRGTILKSCSCEQQARLVPGGGGRWSVMEDGVLSVNCSANQLEDSHATV